MMLLMTLVTAFLLLDLFPTPDQLGDKTKGKVCSTALMAGGAGENFERYGWRAGVRVDNAVVGVVLEVTSGLLQTDRYTSL